MSECLEKGGEGAAGGEAGVSGEVGVEGGGEVFERADFVGEKAEQCRRLRSSDHGGAGVVWGWELGKTKEIFSL